AARPVRSRPADAHHRPGHPRTRSGHLRADADPPAPQRHPRPGAGGHRLAVEGGPKPGRNTAADRGGARDAAQAGADPMTDVYIVDAVRTPIGRYGGALSGVRPDDLAATVVAALVSRQPGLDPAAVDDVYLGDANGAG